MRKKWILLTVLALMFLSTDSLLFASCYLNPIPIPPVIVSPPPPITCFTLGPKGNGKEVGLSAPNGWSGGPGSPVPVPSRGIDVELHRYYVTQ